MAAIRYGTPSARWVLTATVLGSGIAFLDSTVVNVALPAIGEDLDASVGGLQWTANAYLVTLSALLLLGGSLGDRHGRRLVFVAGLATFTAASLLCGLAPNLELLVAARTLQGVGGAMLVPGSLALISASFHPDDRGRAIGMWSGLSGVSTAIGPFVGGWLIDSVSWRLIFLLNVPLAAVAAWISLRHVPESRAAHEGASPPRLDLTGAVLATVGIGSLSYAAIEHGSTAAPAALALGLVSLAAFVVVERRSRWPMVPLELFRIRQFSGANVTTLAVYGGLGGALFLLVLWLQAGLGYSALEAGAALVPFTVVMLLLSPTTGQLARNIGPRIPMTVGPLVAGVGLWLLADVRPGDTYAGDVLAGVLVFGLGMAITVPPLTSAVLGSVGDAHVGVASGINNAVARLAGLLAVAVLPVLSGIPTGEGLREGLEQGYSTALHLSAAACVLGGVVALFTMRTGAPARPVVHPDPMQACGDPALANRGSGAVAGGTPTDPGRGPTA